MTRWQSTDLNKAYLHRRTNLQEQSVQISSQLILLMLLYSLFWVSVHTVLDKICSCQETIQNRIWHASGKYLMLPVIYSFSRWFVYNQLLNYETVNAKERMKCRQGAIIPYKTSGKTTTKNKHRSGKPGGIYRIQTWKIIASKGTYVEETSRVRGWEHLCYQDTTWSH